MIFKHLVELSVIYQTVDNLSAHYWSDCYGRKSVLLFHKIHFFKPKLL